MWKKGQRICGRKAVRDERKKVICVFTSYPFTFQKKERKTKKDKERPMDNVREVREERKKDIWRNIWIRHKERDKKERRKRLYERKEQTKR